MNTVLVSYKTDWWIDWTIKYKRIYKPFTPIKDIYCSNRDSTLTQWELSEMIVILQTTVSKLIFLMKTVVFDLNFVEVRSVVSINKKSASFWIMLSAKQMTRHCLKQRWLGLLIHMYASFCPDELDISIFIKELIKKVKMPPHNKCTNKGHPDPICNNYSADWSVFISFEVNLM